MDEDGYICLTDFGLAKKLERNEQSKTFAGTPAYIAPEVLKGTGHSFPVDWWTLGILVYEMIVGFSPFSTLKNDQNKLFQQIEKMSVAFPEKGRHSIEMSDTCKDFVARLLDKNPATRLGSRGDLKELFEHPWLRDVDVEAIQNKTYKAPLKPRLTTNAEDVSNFCNNLTTREVAHTRIPQKRLHMVR